MVSAVWQDAITCRVTYSGPITATEWADVNMFNDPTSGGVGSVLTQVTPVSLDVEFDAPGDPGDIITQDGGPPYVRSPDQIVTT